MLKTQRSSEFLFSLPLAQDKKSHVATCGFPTCCSLSSLVWADVNTSGS